MCMILDNTVTHSYLQPGSYGAPGDHYSRQQPAADTLPSSYNSDPKPEGSSNPHTQNSVDFTRDQSSEHGEPTGYSYSNNSTNSSVAVPSQNSHYSPSTATESTATHTSYPPHYPPSTSASEGTPKRLHVTNIPFRFREPDLRQLFYVSEV